MEEQQKEFELLQEKVTCSTGKTPDEHYRERDKRLKDVFELRVPDRVPIWIGADGNRFANLPRANAYYDPRPWNNAIIDVFLELEPDTGMGEFGMPGASMDAIQVKNKLWPGGPLPPDYPYQAVEKENMKAEEYDLFLTDPSDFLLRYYLPRIYGALEPLKRMPPLTQIYGSMEFVAEIFTSPEFEHLVRSISKAGKALAAYHQRSGNLQQDLMSLGFPPFSYFGGAGGAPFDIISSFFRGMKGAMLDMYQRPEKLLNLCDLLLKLNIANAMPANPDDPDYPKRAGIPLWRGDKNFMSDEQFQKFYWPGLKKAMMASIDMGYIPVPGFEAHFGKRLECLLELPKGKVIALVDYTDVVQAKNILGGHVCVVSSSPPSLEFTSIKKTEDYYKKLIDDCGEGGGFMMHMVFPKEATLDELKVLISSLKEYGTY